MTAEIKLPPLPSPLFEHQKQMVSGYGRACATAAVLADRQARWLPIETAPRDTSVLCGWWEQWVNKKVWRAEVGGNKRMGSIWPCATHYMPLPPAPQPVESDHIAGAGKKVEVEA